MDKNPSELQVRCVCAHVHLHVCVCVGGGLFEGSDGWTEGGGSGEEGKDMKEW